MMGLLKSSTFLFVLLVVGTVSSLEYSGPYSHPRVRLDGEVRRFRRQTQEFRNVTIQDNHVYYKSKFYSSRSKEASDIWFDVSKQTGIEAIKNHDLSNRFRVYNIMTLPFEFLFYGHTINQVAITTAGFLYTSGYFHSRIYLTQYIAPLQADFNPSLNDSAEIFVYNHTERFTVQWNKVHVTNHEENGTFTFQTSLFPNGTIHFAYREIPLHTSQISSPGHPVRIGLADSFYLDRPLRPNLILRQVYEYSNIELDQEDLSFSAFVLDPVPSCVPANTCQSCVDASKASPFNCGWCDTLNRCSDGVDRHRQDWLAAGCGDSNTTSCSNLNVPGNNSLSGSEKYDNINGPVAKSNSEGKDTKRDDTDISAGFKPLLGVISSPDPTSKPNSDPKRAISTSASASTSLPSTTSNSELDTTKNVRSDSDISSTASDSSLDITTRNKFPLATASPSDASPSAIPRHEPRTRAPHSSTPPTTESPGKKSHSSTIPRFTFSDSTLSNLATPNNLASNGPSEALPSSNKASSVASLSSVSSSTRSLSSTNILPTSSSKQTVLSRAPTFISSRSVGPRVATNLVPTVSTGSDSTASSSIDRKLETQAEEGNSGDRLENFSDSDPINKKREAEGNVSEFNITSVEEEDAEGENDTKSNDSNSNFTPSTNSQEALYLTKGASLPVAVIAGISVFSILVVTALLVLVGTVVGVLCYGYRRPNSKVGLFLIEHRPKARHLNKTKGKYDVDSGKVILEN